MNPKTTLPILFSLLFYAVSAQRVVSGVVVEKLGKSPVYGASISIKGGFDGGTTDSLGRFRFVTDETGAQTILTTYVGYLPAEIPVDLTNHVENLRIALEETPTDIGEVVISAGAFEASDEKKTVVLNAIDIVTIPGANGDITGALNTLPGTTVNGETGQLIVRGGAANETRVYIDGLAVRNYYTSNLPDVPARSRFSPFQFRGTTFASGGYSAEYGQALSSTVILNTPEMPAQGGKNISLSVLGVSGGFTRVRKNDAFSLFGGYTNLGPYMAVVKQNLDIIKAPESGFLAAEGRLRTGNEGMLKYGAQSTLSRVKIGYQALPNETQGFSMGVVNASSRAFLSLRQPVGDRWVLYGAAQGELNGDQYAPSTFSEFELKNAAVSGRASAVYLPNSRFKWKNGGEFNWFRLERSFNPQALKHPVGALFSEVETYAGKRLVLRAGLRGEQDFLLDQSRIAPRLSAAFKTGKEAQLSASWGIFYQSPEDTLLFSSTNLNFEKAEHYILNYQVTRDGRIFRVEGFYKKYDDLVRTITPWDNSGNGYAQGVELFYRDRKSLKWGDYWISYSYLDTRRLHRAYPVSAMPEFAARHNASLVFKYFFKKPSISLGTSYTVQSGRPYYNPTHTEFLSDRTPAYHNFSVQAAKLTNIKGHFTILVISVNNILGFKQVFSYRYYPVPDSNPTEYYRQEVGPVAPRFIFMGCFINIGDKRKTVTKEEALE